VGVQQVGVQQVGVQQVGVQQVGVQQVGVEPQMPVQGGGAQKQQMQQQTMPRQLQQQEPVRVGEPQMQQLVTNNQRQMLLMQQRQTQARAGDRPSSRSSASCQSATDIFQDCLVQARRKDGFLNFEHLRRGIDEKVADCPPCWRCRGTGVLRLPIRRMLHDGCLRFQLQNRKRVAVICALVSVSAVCCVLCAVCVDMLDLAS